MLKNFRRSALVVVTLTLVAQANAQTQIPGSGLVSDPVAEFAGTPDSIAFDISVRTPPEFNTLRELVEKHIELQRYRAVADLDDAELARLIALAERDVRKLIGTLGHFNP